MDYYPTTRAAIATLRTVFGTSTDTLDSAGKVLSTFDMSALTPELVQSMVTTHLTGHIMQVPPMVSALKVDGKRLHELAREGIEIERQARPVTVSRFEVAPTESPLVYAIEVQCSKGTYIRTLADDLGRLCGGGAHLRNLRRTAVGSFTATEAAAPDDVELLSLPQAMRDYPQVTISAEAAVLVGNGRLLDRARAGFQGDGPWAVLGPDGQLLAMYEERDAVEAKPSVVLA